MFVSLIYNLDFKDDDSSSIGGCKVLKIFYYIGDYNRGVYIATTIDVNATTNVQTSIEGYLTIKIKITTKV